MVVLMRLFYLRLALCVGFKCGAVFFKHFAKFGIHGTKSRIGESLVKDNVDDLSQNFHTCNLGLEQINHLLAQRLELVCRELVEYAGR